MSQVGFFNFIKVVESLGGNTGDLVFPQAGNIYILGGPNLNVNGNNTTGALTITLGGAVMVSATTDDTHVAVPATGNMNFFGTDNVYSTSVLTPVGNTITYHLKDSISLPATIATGLKGVINIGSSVAIQMLDGNLFLGGAGNFTLTTSDSNVGAGSGALESIVSGDSNVSLGVNSGASLLRGSNNIFLGTASGTALIDNESNNICIGSAGVAAMHNKIYIGTYGTGAAEQDTAYIAGIVHATNGLVSDAGDISSTAGSVSAHTTLTAGTDIISTAGVLKLPTTTATAGQIQINSIPVFHTLGIHNLFSGEASAFSYNTAYATDNVGLGYNAMHALVGIYGTVGLNNVAIGSGAASAAENIANCIAIGHNAGSAWQTTEKSNIAINSLGVVSESNTLRIGSGTGTGAKQLNRVFISGINGVTSSNLKYVTIDSVTDQLGVSDGGSLSGIVYLKGDDLNTATGSTVNVNGGKNLTSSASGATLLIDMDDSITLSGDVTALNFKTSTVANNLTINGNTITSGGSGTDIDINLVAKGIGGLTFDGISTGWSNSEWHIRQSEVQTTDATVTPLVTIPLVEGEMITITATINGFQSDFTDALGSTVVMTAYRPTGGNVTQIGEEVININATSTATVSADVNVGTQSMVIYVTGVAAENWNWISTHQYMFTKTNL
jgi:hypothetical protein